MHSVAMNTLKMDIHHNYMHSSVDNANDLSSSRCSCTPPSKEAWDKAFTNKELTVLTCSTVYIATSM